MTDRSDIAARVRKLISAHMEKTYDETTEDKVLIDDLGVDSLDSVEIVMAIEEEFDLEVSDNEAEHLTTVGHVVDLVERLLQAAPVA